MHYKSILILICLFLSGNTDAQLYQQWCQKFGSKGPHSNVDTFLYVGNVVVDEAGNSYVNGEDNFDNFVIKFNSNGQVAWRVDGLAYGVILEQQEHYGLYYNNGNIYYVGNNGITSISQTGSIQWLWQYPSPLDNIAVDPVVVFNKQGELAITYQENWYDSVQNVAVVNQNGVMLWTKRYSVGTSEDTSIMNFDIKFDYNGNVCLCLAFLTEISGNESDIDRVYKFDHSGNLIWQYNCPTKNGGYPFYLDPHINGDLWAFSYNGWNHLDSVFVFDSNGNLKSTSRCSYYYKPIYSDSNYHYYWAWENSAGSVTGIFKTDDNFNTIASNTISNSYVEPVLYSNGNLYAVGGRLAFGDTTIYQTPITIVNNQCQQVQTVIATYHQFIQNDAGTNAAVDSAGDVYVLMYSDQDSVALYKFCSKCTPNITGQVYNDANNNCLIDSNELGIEGRIITANPGSYTAVSDSDGSFGLIVPEGNYTITSTVPQYWQATCNDSINVFIGNSNDSVPVLFGSYQLPNIADVEVQLCATVAYPGAYQQILVNYSNPGSVTTNGYIQVNLDSFLIFKSATPSPDSISGNSIFWNYTNLQTGQQAEIDILDSVPTFLNSFYSYILTAEITPLINDVDTTNNYDTIEDPIWASFDPNLKISSATNKNSSGDLTDSSVLTYTILFQNTGNDTAHKIIIIDTLSPNLDAATFTLLQTSFKSYQLALLHQNILQITFNNIALPDSQINPVTSVGLIKYSIKPLAGLQYGTGIFNSANIYFDFNAGVSTNTTADYEQKAPSVSPVPGIYNTIYLYPNPASNLLFLIPGNIQPFSMTIYDINGRKIYAMPFKNEVDISNLSSGVYFVEVTSDAGKVRKRFIKM